MYVDIWHGVGKWQRTALELVPKADDLVDFFKTWQIYTSEVFGPVGTMWGNFPLDFDDKNNLDKARIDCIRVHDMLTSQGVMPENIRISFSGKKGFHLEIDYRSFMTRPEKNLHEVYAILFEHIEKKIKPENGKSTMDSLIYKSRCQFRIINTIHSGTGYYCIPLTRDELDLTLDAIKALAVSKKYLDYTYVADPAFRRKYEGALELYYQSCIEYEEREVAVRTFAPGQYPPCISRALAICNMAEGSRNDLIYALARSLRKFASEQEIEIMLIAWCKNNQYPEQEALHTIRQAMKATEINISCTKFRNYYSEYKLCDKQMCDNMSHEEGSKHLQAISSKFDVATLKEATSDLKVRIQQGEFKRILETGINALDNKTMILQDSLIVIGANSNYGKTSLATTIIANNANKKILWFPLEEGKDRACIRAAKAGFLTDNIQILTGSLGIITPEDINSAIEVYQPDFIVIDQLINMACKWAMENERLKYKKIMEGLREIARVQKTPIILLHQLTREAMNQAIEPIKEHLAEGADIERLAYDVWLIYRRKGECSGNEYTILKIAKNKFGPSGLKLPLQYSFDRWTYDNFDFSKFNLDNDFKQLGIDTLKLDGRITEKDIAIQEILDNEKI